MNTTTESMISAILTFYAGRSKVKQLPIQPENPVGEKANVEMCDKETSDVGERPKRADAS